MARRGPFGPFWTLLVIRDAFWAQGPCTGRVRGSGTGISGHISLYRRGGSGFGGYGSFFFYCNHPPYEHYRSHLWVLLEPELQNGQKMTQNGPWWALKGPQGKFWAILDTFGHLRRILGPRTLYRTGLGVRYRDFWPYLTIPDGGRGVGTFGYISLYRRGVRYRKLCSISFMYAAASFLYRRGVSGIGSYAASLLCMQRPASYTVGGCPV